MSGRRKVAMDDLELEAAGEGTRMRLRVKPGARSNRIAGEHGGALKLSVTAPPEKGKANRAVVSLLAEALDLPKAAVRIVSGESSQDKTVRLDLPPGELRRRLG